MPACGSHTFRATTCPVTMTSPCGQPASHRYLFCPQDYVDAPLSIPDFLTCSLNIDWSQYQVRGLTLAGQSKGRRQEDHRYLPHKSIMQIPEGLAGAL